MAEAIISKYFVQYDGASYSDYVFEVILKSTGENHQSEIIVNRSYLDFCDLCMHISKSFPDFNISDCPLEGFSAIVNRKKQLVSKRASFLSMSNIDDESQNNTYKSFFAEDRTSYLISNSKEVDEGIEDTISRLNIWLRSILSDKSCLTIIESQIFAKFFNFEDSNFCGNNMNEKYKLVNEHDLLMLPKNFTMNKTVLTKHLIPYEIDTTIQSYFIYKFVPINNDIQFSVTINNDMFIDPKRYNALSVNNGGDSEWYHCGIYAISSSLDTNTNNRPTTSVTDTTTSTTVSTAPVNRIKFLQNEVNILEVKFENKFSSMFSPVQINYCFRIVDVFEFEDVKRRVSEKNTVVRRRLQELECIQNVLRRQSSKLRKELSIIIAGGTRRRRSSASTNGDIALALSNIEISNDVELLKESLWSLRRDHANLKYKYERLLAKVKRGHNRTLKSKGKYVNEDTDDDKDLTKIEAELDAEDDEKMHSVSTSRSSSRDDMSEETHDSERLVNRESDVSTDCERDAGVTSTTSTASHRFSIITHTHDIGQSNASDSFDMSSMADSVVTANIIHPVIVVRGDEVDSDDDVNYRPAVNNVDDDSDSSIEN